ncbi:hypothetical protein [Paraferrimonas sp. SM1919]|uniref:beta strand repeat-containing protein n=1 Tax=Paraferrimonas sp. SM1919 TaxID=2662263 RepID=UPI0013D245D0|nr:hypothetical protein [Paraferrimonas sp. SM1919]
MKTWLLSFSLIFLVACGGSGDDSLTRSGGGTSVPVVTDSYAISLTLSDNNGQAVTEISAANPATVNAYLTKNGAPYANQIVTFSADALVRITPEIGTAITDTNGMAKVTINATDIAGAGKVYAEAFGATSNIAFASVGDASISEFAISLDLQDPQGFSSHTTSASSPLIVTATLTLGGAPVANEVVTFNLASIGQLNPNSGTRLTDSAGKATIELQAGDIEGAGEISATAKGTQVSASFASLGDQLAQQGYQLSLRLTNDQDIDITQISAANPGFVKVSVNFEGEPQAHQLVSFASELGEFASERATALTDENGLAQMKLFAGTVEGAAEIIVNANGVTNRIAYATLGDGQAVNNDYQLQAQLLNKAGTPTNQISAAQPGVVSVTLTKAQVPVSNAVVNFAISNIGLLTPESGSALTDANGQANITLLAGENPGAGTVVITSQGQLTEVNYASAGDGGSQTVQVQLELVDEFYNPVGNVSAQNPAKIVATVTGQSQQTIVNFSTSLGRLPITSAVTNDQGQAEVTLYAGDVFGAGLVEATTLEGYSATTIVVIGATEIKMGSGDPFQSGLAEVSLETLSAGGTATVSVDLVDGDNNPYLEPVEVSFSSNCANLEPAEARISSPVFSVNGQATTTYLAQGCVGDDPINVNANAGGVNLSAATSINVLAASVGSMVFVSATPEQIGILGTGGVGSAESSTLLFKVLDSNGNPVANQDVQFSLNTEVGGIQINPTQATTNNLGLVQTVVNSGSVATSVRVLAQIVDLTPGVFSQSSNLVISTGIPDQDSISLSASILNPEAWNIDGTSVEITARLADAYNNPVPDGTAVSFTTEGGVIEPSCLTSNGSCSVMWTSTEPRPVGNQLINSVGELVFEPQTSNFLGQSYGGRVTILATAIGEESFPDSNGNGRFDQSEFSLFSGNDISGDPYDQAEAFVDYNEDGVFNPAVAGETGGDLEEFLDFNNNGSFDSADGHYNGVLCSIDVANPYCGAAKTINVSDSLVLVMSGSTAYSSVPTIIDNQGSNVDDDINVDIEGSGSISMVLSDLHNQPLAAGTVVEASVNVGSVVPSSYTINSTNYNGGIAYTFDVFGSAEAEEGNLLIQATTPNGTTTLLHNIKIIVGAP